MEQTIINWIIGLGGTVIGIFIKSMLDSIKDLQKSDKEMSERVGSIEGERTHPILVGDRQHECTF